MSAPGQPRVAIVTGGGGGIGRALALALAKDGYHVTIVGRSESRLQVVLQELHRVEPMDGSPEHMRLSLDVTREADMVRMADAVLDRFGRIDLLITSAGLGKQTGSTRLLPHPTRDLPLAEWAEVIGINLTGVFLSNRAVLPAMVRQGVGHIVNICSSTTPHGLQGTPYAPAYCASKYGVVGFSEALAIEVAPLGVRVQVVLPGPVVTPLVDQTLLARPFGGSVEPENFAAAVVYFIRQPSDEIIVHPHVLPCKSRPLADGREPKG